MRADVVVLRNGQRIEGAVRIIGDTVRVTTADNRTVTVKRAEVQTIEAGRTKKPAPFKITPELRERVELHQRLTALAAALRRGGPRAAKAAKELSDAGVDALPFLSTALEDADGRVVSLALRALGAAGGRAAAETLAGRLPGLKPDLQVAAIEVLGAPRSLAPAAAVASLLRREDTPQAVRLAAVKALGTLRSDLLVPFLVRALGRAETARAAAATLVELDSPSAVAYLDKLISKGGDPGRHAATVLSKIARPEHVDLLLRLKQGDTLAERNAAAAALARLKEDRAARLATYVRLAVSKNRREANAADAWLRKLTRVEPKNRREWASWWTKQNEARPRIAVIPLGEVDPAAPRLVRLAVEKGSGFRTAVAPRQQLSRWSRAASPGRYQADALLDQLEQWLRDNPPAVAAIGITAAPVEQHDAGQVIGAFRHGSCGLVSLPGLKAKDNAQALRARLGRYALHLAARALRVATAEANNCPAAPLYAPGELDRFRNEFSLKTSDHLKRSVATTVALFAGDLRAALRSLGELQAVTNPRRHAVEMGLVHERALDLRQARRQWAAAKAAPGDPNEAILIEDRIELIDKLTGAK